MLRRLGHVCSSSSRVRVLRIEGSPCWTSPERTSFGTTVRKFCLFSIIKTKSIDRLSKSLQVLRLFPEATQSRVKSLAVLRTASVSRRPSTALMGPAKRPRRKVNHERAAGKRARHNMHSRHSLPVHTEHEVCRVVICRSTSTCSNWTRASAGRPSKIFSTDAMLLMRNYRVVAFRKLKFREHRCACQVFPL